MRTRALSVPSFLCAQNTIDWNKYQCITPGSLAFTHRPGAPCPQLDVQNTIDWNSGSLILQPHRLPIVRKCRQIISSQIATNFVMTSFVMNEVLFMKISLFIDCQCKKMQQKNNKFIDCHATTLCNEWTWGFFCYACFTLDSLEWFLFICVPFSQRRIKNIPV